MDNPAFIMFMNGMEMMGLGLEGEEKEKAQVEYLELVIDELKKLEKEEAR